MYVSKLRYFTGQVLRFKNEAFRARYGDFATVKSAQEVETRPFGYCYWLIDLVTANGTQIQWPQRDVTGRMKPLGN